MDLPCSRCFLWLHAGGTEPREHLRPLALSRPAVPPSPLSDRVGYSDHVRFRGYIPVHFIPAYNLPVYASQRPLPDATQDSVSGLSLIHISEPTRLLSISYAVFCLKKKK